MSSQERLHYAVDRVADRILRLRAWRWRTLCWLGLAVLACALIAARRWWGFDITTNQIIGTLVVGVVASFLLQLMLLRRKPSLETARRIEATHPDLDDALLAAMDQRPAEPDGKLNYLQTEVVRKAVKHNTFSDWLDVVPAKQMKRWMCAGLCSLVLFLTCSTFAFEGIETAVAGKRPFLPSRSADGTIYGLVVEPGDTEVEKGTSLLVMARFEGQIPAAVSLDLKADAAGDIKASSQKFTMAPGVDSNLYLARVPSVNASGTYQIQYDDEQTSEFKVTVFTVPALDQADAHITCPKYANLDKKIVQDTRRISVLQGSDVEWRFHLNKAIASAELREQNGEIVKLSAMDGDNVQGVTLKATKARRFTLHLKDADGRVNKFPPDIAMSVVENKRPDLKLAFPGKDRPVSPLEEMAVEAKVSDDFGLESFGVVYSLVGQDEKNITLGEKAEPKTKHLAAHTLSLEEMKAEPDQLVSYHFYADDYGPDGELRRTFSDMYFAEVRRFEEIFRQGRQQPGGQQQQQRQQQQGQGQQGQQGGQGEKLDQLGQLQKQIMTATWNLARRPSLDMQEAEGIEKAKADVKVLSASQETARGQVQEMAGELQDATMQAVAADLIRSMDGAVNTLNDFDTKPTADTLKDAMKLEQQSYQRILQLRAKEFEVQRQQQQQQQQQQQGQQGQQNSRRQQQLNQLEMNNRQNRYEQQNQAQQQQQQQQNAEVNQEQLRILNRLRELARRQEAINEKLKQLESELRQAKTEEERDEIERQLKRLRDEQQQMLRDIDETAESIDKQDNMDQADQMAQQAQEARDNALKTSEALKENQLSRAISEGTRTERDLENLRDDFRRQTANEFQDVMRQMRNEARDVEEKQKDIGKQLANNEDSKSLRYAEKRKELEKQLQSQAERVSDLSEKMREVVKQSEDSEPLLARKLYDAARQMKDKPPEKDIEAERFLVNRGFMEQAKDADKEAQQGIQKMREGIEQAAETVLGDELEGLRRAQQEIDRLRNQLGGELTRNDPEEASRASQPRGQQGERQPRDGEQREGEQRDGQRGQNGERNQNREQREGQQGQGEPREGQQRQEGQQGQRGQQGQQDREGQRGQNGERREGQQRDGQQGQREGQQREGQRGQDGERNQNREQREGQQGQGEPREGQQRQEGQQGQRGQQGQQNREGQQGGQREGQQREGQQQRDGQQNREGQQREQQGQRGQQPGQGGGQGRQNQEQREQRDGQQRDGQRQNGEPRDGQQRDQEGQPRDGQQRGGGLRNLARNTNGLGGSRPQDIANPITGEEYREWTDGLRDVEEMLDDPELRSDVARIRDRARGVRIDLKRHSKDPQWDLVRKEILQPMVELQDRIREEILKKDTKKSRVPIDRDPVPNKYAEMVRRYYEEIGRTVERPVRADAGSDPKPNAKTGTDEKAGVNE